MYVIIWKHTDLYETDAWAVLLCAAITYIIVWKYTGLYQTNAWAVLICAASCLKRNF